MKKTKSIPQLQSAKDFDDLCDIIRIRSERYPTNFVDLQFIGNTDKRLSDILEFFRSHVKTSANKDFKSEARLRYHIQYRKEHDKWIFTFSGISDDPIVRLTGLR